MPKASVLISLEPWLALVVSSADAFVIALYGLSLVARKSVAAGVNSAVHQLFFDA